MGEQVAAQQCVALGPGQRNKKKSLCGPRASSLRNPDAQDAWKSLGYYIISCVISVSVYVSVFISVFMHAEILSINEDTAVLFDLGRIAM